MSETSADEAAEFVQSDAWLAIANARMHLVHDWDSLVEARAVGTVQAEGLDLGVLAAVYRQLGNNFEIGLAITLGGFPVI